MLGSLKDGEGLPTELTFAMAVKHLQKGFDTEELVPDHEVFTPGKEWTSIPGRFPDSPEVRPDSDDACVYASAYYACSYLGTDVTVQELEAVSVYGKDSGFLDFIDIEALIERIPLEYDGRQELETESKSFYAGGGRPEHILHLAEEIVEGNALLVAIPNQAALYGEGFEDSTRHVLMLYGFGVTEDGKQYFKGIDGSVGGNRIIEYPATYLGSVIEDGYLAVRQKDTPN